MPICYGNKMHSHSSLLSPPYLPSLLLAILQVDMPIFYGNKMRRKMKAGAGCEDLKVRCPHYYSVATRLHAAQQACLTADEAFPAFVLNTFRSRYKVRRVLCDHCCACVCCAALCCAHVVWGCIGAYSRGGAKVALPVPAAAARAGPRCCLSALHPAHCQPPNLPVACLRCPLCPSCRLQELLTKAPQIESSLEATQIQGKLSSEEAQVCSL
jgi:hypothetical protein